MYVALTELASEEGCHKFEATHLKIMQKAGIRSDRTVRNRLQDLEAIGLIAIRKNHINNRLRAPSTYGLLSSVIITDRSATTGPSRLPREEKNLKNWHDEGDSLTAGEKARMMQIRCKIGRQHLKEASPRSK